MSVITFVNNSEEETGKTMSLVAIATNMAIENNNRILIISTTNKEDKIRNCYFGEKQEKNSLQEIMGESKNTIDTENGIEGIAKIARSNKLTPDTITNYTRVVFKDRLEVIFGTEKKDIYEDMQEKDIAEEYIDLISVANMYYDKVFVDLDSNIDEDIREQILNRSNLIILNTNQNFSSLKKLKEKKAEWKSLRNLILIGRYDRFSKYNVKNITRFLEEKNQVLTIPYNTLFFEAMNEANVQDLFLSLRKKLDSDDKNTFFIEEIKRASEKIEYRLQELQAMI